MLIVWGSLGGERFLNPKPDLHTVIIHVVIYIYNIYTVKQTEYLQFTSNYNLHHFTSILSSRYPLDPSGNLTYLWKITHLQWIFPWKIRWFSIVFCMFTRRYIHSLRENNDPHHLRFPADQQTSVPIRSCLGPGESAEKTVRLSPQMESALKLGKIHENTISIVVNYVYICVLSSYWIKLDILALWYIMVTLMF